MEELRAKDLAAIEPPSSMAKIVQFTEQLSFGQNALFSGTELPPPPITRDAFAAQSFARNVMDRPYSMFPGANGESLDTLMARHTLRNRDVQDFSKWLRRWEDKREGLTRYDSPEQYFLKHATRDDVEKVAANREVQEAAIQARRKQVRSETVQDVEVVRSVVKVKRQRTEYIDDGPVEVKRVRRRKQPEPPQEEPDYGAYWRESPKTTAKAGLVLGGGRVASAAAATPVDPGIVFSTINKGLVTSNLSMGSMTTGLIRGQSDATAAFRAQEAASSAVQNSPVAAYMPPQPGQLYFHVPRHYPPPQVTIEQMPGGPPIEVRTDWPGAQQRAALPGKSDDYVLVPREAADQRGIDRNRTFRPEPSVKGGHPGFMGLGSESFANALALRSLVGAAALFPTALLAATSAMPSGSLPRRNLLLGAPGQGESGVISRSVPEAAVRTDIPVNPLMGQLTLVSPPMHVASEKAERAGSVVAFDVRQVGKSVGTLDAAGLAMLRQSLPPGAQAIYPALPPGSLGPQAVNVKLAPSLLNQILTQGYGPGVGSLADSFAAGAAGASLHADGAPMRASIVPSLKRPTDAGAGVLPDHDDGPGALKHAGAAGATRGGALDFLGMPVRLAPSLSGNAELQQATEARKVMPGGAAAVIRPNEFGAMRSKLFPGMQTLHAEPDKHAWQQAAPSFGLRDAAPHTLLAPDARVRAPHATAPLPQMDGGAQTATSRALHAATVIAPAASAAIGVVPGGGIVERAAQAALGSSQRHAVQMSLNGMGASSGAPGGLGDVRFQGIGSPFVQRLPSGRAAPAIGPDWHAPHFRVATAASAASAASSRVASRFTPPHSSAGHHGSSIQPEQPGIGGSSEISEERHGKGAAGSARATMAPAGIGRAPLATQAPAGLGGSGALAPTAHAYHVPSMRAPAAPTTAAGRLSGVTAPAPSLSGYSAPALPIPSANSTPSSASMVRRSPSMPIATSVPASRGGPSAPSIQRSASGAVQASGNEHSAKEQKDSSTAKAQDPGAAAHEVNLLANEVWSLLKRKLQFEAERLGKKY